MPASAAINFQSRAWLAGFLPVGVLLGMIGPLLVGWQYHLDADPRAIGLHFLALNAGYIGASLLFQRRLKSASLPKLPLLATAVAVLALVGLSMAAPPVPVVWRLLGLAAAGIAAGTLVPLLFHSLDLKQNADAGFLIHSAGAWFGGGCFLASLLIAGMYSLGRASSQTLLLAAIPAAFLVVFARAPLSGGTGAARPKPPAGGMHQVATVVFTLLLFFQFGSEWALAGWLPLFLIRRLGSSPTAAILALAVYFLFLLLGRFLAQALLSVVSRSKLLLASTLLAMGGYLALANAGSFSSAYTAIVLVGLGFGPVYPLVLGTLDHRFSFQPSFYNGIFSVAVTGAMAEPWLLGYVCEYFGMQYVVLIPALGSVLVCLLALLLMLEAHTMREPAAGSRGELLY